MCVSFGLFKFCFYFIYREGTGWVCSLKIWSIQGSLSPKKANEACHSTWFSFLGYAWSDTISSLIFGITFIPSLFPRCWAMDCTCVSFNLHSHIVGTYLSSDFMDGKLRYNLPAKATRVLVINWFCLDIFHFNHFNILFDSPVQLKTEFWCISDSVLSHTTKFVFHFTWQLYKALSLCRGKGGLERVIVKKKMSQSQQGDLPYERDFCFQKLLSLNSIIFWQRLIVVLQEKKSNRN